MFAPEKGIELLLGCFKLLPEETKVDWPLVLIGDGVLKGDIVSRKSKHIVVKPFLQPEALIEELMQGG